MHKLQIPLDVFGEIYRNTQRLFAMVWEEDRRKVLLIGLLHLFSAMLPFIESGMWALFINELVRQAGSGRYEPYLLTITAFALGVGVLPQLLSLYLNHQLTMFRFRVEEILEMKMKLKLAAIDLPTYEDPKFNDLLANARDQGTWRVRSFLERNYYLIYNVLRLVIASTILFYASWWLALIVVLCAVPSLLVEVFYGKRVWSIWDSNAKIRRRYQDLGWRFSHPNSVVELCLFQNVRYFFRLCKSLFLQYRDEQRSYETSRTAWQVITNVVSQAAYLIAAIYFIAQVVNGQIQIGTFSFLLGAIGSFGWAISSLFMNLGEQYADNLFVSDFFRVIDLPRVIKPPQKPVRLTSSAVPEIVFDNVSFRYPGSNDFALQDVSVRIAPGDKIGVVGKNGAGKSTFIKLLCRLYDCTDGRITIDGIDIQELELQSWYERLGVMSQNYQIYHFPVKEAIYLGDTSSPLDLDRVKRAARQSEADEFIAAWPEQYDQMLGKQFEGGREPSWGQWQKLALARALYRDAPVLVLDEPTASVDAEAEAKIFEGFRNLERTQSLLLVSHRFSTVRNNVDTILLFDEGRLKERGSHQELLDLQGQYSHLFNLQAEGYAVQ